MRVVAAVISVAAAIRIQDNSEPLSDLCELPEFEASNQPQEGLLALLATSAGQQYGVFSILFPYTEG